MIKYIKEKISLLGWDIDLVENKKDIIRTELTKKKIPIYTDKDNKEESYEYFFKIIQKMTIKHQNLQIINEWITNLYNKGIERERYINSKVFNYIILSATLLTLNSTVGEFKITFLILYSLILLLFLITYKSKRTTEIGTEYILSLSFSKNENFIKTLLIDLLIDIEYIKLRLQFLNKIIRVAESMLFFVFVFSSISLVFQKEKTISETSKDIIQINKTETRKELNEDSKRAREKRTAKTSTSTTAARTKEGKDRRGNAEKK